MILNVKRLLRAAYLDGRSRRYVIKHICNAVLYDCLGSVGSGIGRPRRILCLMRVGKRIAVLIDIIHREVRIAAFPVRAVTENNALQLAGFAAAVNEHTVNRVKRASESRAFGNCFVNSVAAGDIHIVFLSRKIQHRAQTVPLAGFADNGALLPVGIIVFKNIVSVGIRCVHIAHRNGGRVKGVR